MRPTALVGTPIRGKLGAYPRIVAATLEVGGQSEPRPPADYGSVQNRRTRGTGGAKMRDALAASCRPRARRVDQLARAIPSRQV